MESRQSKILLILSTHKKGTRELEWMCAKTLRARIRHENRAEWYGYHRLEIR